MPIAQLALDALAKRCTKPVVAKTSEKTATLAAVRMQGDALQLTSRAVKPSTRASKPEAAVGLTPHFKAWLEANGYGKFNFAHADLAGGSFGGKAGPRDVPSRQPVIFIHGNSDAALGTEHARHTGWDNSINYFLDKGYKPSELYAFTWGEGNADQMLGQYHSKEHLTSVRAFIEAVLDYTGAEKVDVVGHSMGVTLARKAIKGGFAHDALAGGAYHLGEPLSGKIDTMVGIAGANEGLASCYGLGGLTPVSSATNGFYPGILPGVGQSRFLSELNANRSREADHVYSIYGLQDEVTGPSNLVWGRRTSRIAGQDGEKVFDSAAMGHNALKDRTASIQYDMVVNHKIR